MTKTITGEEIFQILTPSFSASPSNEGYTLSYSADGANFTDYDKAVPANENLLVNGVPSGVYFKLKGNASEITIRF